MGMAVETSMAGRDGAAMAAGAVDDDARQDEGHAGEANQVRDVLGADHGVGLVAQRREVEHDIEDAARGHEAEAQEHHDRERSQVAHVLYR
jgi:hypothetical protein